MKLKKRTKKRVQRTLCAFLATVGLSGLLPGKAFAADLGKISKIGTEAEQPSVAGLDADTNLGALAKQLGTTVGSLRFVRIYYAGNTDNCVDIPGDRVHKEGTQGILYEAHFANPNQIFVLNAVGNGIYRIICLESGKLLEVKDGSRQDCTPIVQRSIHGNPNGMWKLIQNRDGTVSFQNMETGGMLNAKGGQTDSNQLIQFHEDGTIAKRFYVKEVEEDELLCATGGRYVRILYAINPTKCVDVPAEGILKNGTQLQLWDCYYGNQNQIQILEKSAGNGWTITNHQSGKIIEVRNSSHQNGAQVAQWDPHSSACARWDILANIDGTVSFRNRESMKYLNLCGGGSGKNGQRFIQWFDDNSESMRFKVLVMGTSDVLCAVYEREITNSDIQWTPEHPLMTVRNTTGWSVREDGTWHYPSVGQKVFVSAEYLSPNAAANLLKERAYSRAVWEKIQEVLAGESSEEAVAYVLKEIGFDVPGVGMAMGVLQTLLNIREENERNRLVDAVNVDARGRCSGVILYTYKTVTMTPDYSKVDGRWKIVQKIETITNVDYRSWTGDNFTEVCTLLVSGTTGTWHYNFK